MADPPQESDAERIAKVLAKAEKEGREPSIAELAKEIDIGKAMGDIQTLMGLPAQVINLWEAFKLQNARLDQLEAKMRLLEKHYSS